MWFQSPQYLQWSRMLLLRKENIDAVLQQLPMEDDWQVLDVGCGSGELIHALHPRVGARFTGVDLDPALINAARILGDSRAEYLCADAAKLPFADSSFDLVLSHTFFTSIFDAETAMAEMRRVCRPGGIIASVTADCMVFVPHSAGVYPPEPWVEEFRCLRSRLDDAFHRLGQQSMNGVLPEQMPRFFSAAGLEQVHVATIGKFSSLSNENADFRSRFLALELEAEKTRLHLLPEEDRQRYLSLLVQRNQYLSRPENSIWDWSGGCHLLIRGINPGKTDPSQQNNAPSRRLAHSLTEQYLCVGCQRAHVEGVATVHLRHNTTGKRLSGTGATPADALRQAYREAEKWLLQERPRETLHLSQLLGSRLTRKTMAGLEPQLLCPEESSLANALAQWGTDFPVYSFTSVHTGAESPLPACLLQSCYSDTLCMGATREEALAEGMYAVCQNYALKRLVRENKTPPVLTINWTRYPRLHSWVSTLQGHGYRLRFFDASLGEGIPALGVLAAKNARVRLVIRADFSREKALEKCLLGLLAGRTATTLLSGAGCIRNAPASPGEMASLLHTGEGPLPPSILGNLPDWESTPCEDCEDPYSKLDRLFREKNWEVWYCGSLRENAFVFHMVVPDAGLPYDFGMQRLVEYRLCQAAQPILRNFPAASAAEQELAMKYVRMKQSWPGENTFSFLAGLSQSVTLFGVEVDAAIFTGLYLLSRNRAAEAAACFPSRVPDFACLKDLLLHADPQVCAFLHSEALTRAAIALVQDPWQSIFPGYRQRQE